MDKKYVVYTINYQGIVRYVGKTSDFNHRKWYHLNQRGTHYSAIPEDIDLSLVTFEQVAYFDREEEALKLEDELMLQYNTINNGWNKYRSGLVRSDREYVLAHMRDYSAAYYQTHREALVVYQRDYYQANREYVLARQKDYNAAHKQQKAAYDRERYQARKKALRDIQPSTPND